jgi:DNA polymerase III delta prime subunit|tara:strand:- start:5572 stop:6510 length:939 start_codon:yes stop_codon:yes gene_type:complete
MNEEFLWVQKYRPQTIADTILSSELKQTFQQFVNQENIPNLLLTGSAGIGKTTVAKALCEQLNADYIVINGSMNGNIDTLRTEIMQFASSVSFTGGRKYVILDEADYLNPQSTQPALRNFMEEFSKNCGFILTCNFKNRVIEPLHSRCTVIDFKTKGKDKAKLAAKFFKRLCDILTNENVEFEDKVVAELVNLHFPDWRRVINECQRYASTGRIDSGILANLNQESFKQLITYMKAKEYQSVRKWVGENGDIDASQFFRAFYDTAWEEVSDNSVPGVVITLGEYQYKHSFAADPEINIMAFLTAIMFEVTWK